MERTQLGLDSIRDTVVQVADAIATILKIDVTIVDEQQRRIAATGQYKKRVNSMISSDSIFTKMLKECWGQVITERCRSEHCQECSGKETCQELAHLCCPIIVQERTVGLISLIAFTSRQQNRLLRKTDSYVNFLRKMASLLGSKLQETEASIQLSLQKDQLEAIIDSVSEGVLTVDKNGIVILCNKNAGQLLGLSQTDIVGGTLEALFPNSNLNHLIQSKKPRITTFYRTIDQGNQLYLLAGVRPLITNADGVGAVLTIRTIREVYEMATKVSSKSAFSGFDLIIGGSPAMNAAISIATRAARQSSTILIQGESGTGKELFARAIHQESPRREKPFIAINCGAIPDNLLESELFGYEEGAFTGTKAGGKPGKIELAEGGTLFLDEIGDMPPHLQVKLLRFLQDNRIERLGGTTSRAVNIRIIAATHQNLEALMAERRFREDLFYRLSVVPIEIPPLRERKEEIPFLIDFFLNKYSQIYAKKVIRLSKDTCEILYEYHWPGNIREFENCIEYAVNMVEGAEIDVEHLPRRIREKPKRDNKVPDIMSVEEMEARLLKLAWQKFGSCDEGTQLIADALKIGRTTVYRKLKKYGICN